MQFNPSFEQIPPQKLQDLTEHFCDILESSICLLHISTSAICKRAFIFVTPSDVMEILIYDASGIFAGRFQEYTLLGSLKSIKVSTDFVKDRSSMRRVRLLDGKNGCLDFEPSSLHLIFLFLSKLKSVWHDDSANQTRTEWFVP